jgi:hypothetical protein
VLKDGPRICLSHSSFVMRGRILSQAGFVKLRFSDLAWLGGCKTARTCHLAVLCGAVIKEVGTAWGGLSVQTMGTYVVMGDEII